MGGSIEGDFLVVLFPHSETLNALDMQDQLRITNYELRNRY